MTIYGIARPQPVHKGAIIPHSSPATERLPYHLVAIACGRITAEPPDKGRYQLWSDEWAETTCKECLRDRP